MKLYLKQFFLGRSLKNIENVFLKALVTSFCAVQLLFEDIVLLCNSQIAAVIPFSLESFESVDCFQNHIPYPLMSVDKWRTQLNKS